MDENESQLVATKNDFKELECRRCGVCCRRLKVNGGCRIESMKPQYPLTDETREEWKQNAALLKRILIETNVEKGRNGRKIHWYRCRMLWLNPESKQWECLIYNSRPSMCEKFKPGSISIPHRAPCVKERIKRIKETPPRDDFEGCPTGEIPQ